MLITRENGVRIIINDRVDIALAVKADGIHLGQDDLPPENARRILGDDAVIGFSTHSIEQARHAISMPVNYIAIGPLFPTKTKENPDETIGIEGLRRVRDSIGDFPLVAIGGITIDNIASVFEAGAGCAAMIGELLSEPDAISEKTREFLTFCQ